jgi:hypothetical protein
LYRRHMRIRRRRRRHLAGLEHQGRLGRKFALRRAGKLATGMVPVGNSMGDVVRVPVQKISERERRGARNGGGNIAGRHAIARKCAGKWTGKFAGIPSHTLS